MSLLHILEVEWQSYHAVAGGWWRHKCPACHARWLCLSLLPSLLPTGPLESPQGAAGHPQCPRGLFNARFSNENQKNWPSRSTRTLGSEVPREVGQRASSLPSWPQVENGPGLQLWSQALRDVLVQQFSTGVSRHVGGPQLGHGSLEHSSGILLKNSFAFCFFRQGNCLW